MIQLDLDVWFDEKLSFREHIQDNINKAYMMFGIIMQTFKHSTIAIFILIYKTMARFHIDYCCSVWAPYKKGDIETLKKVQKRGKRFCQHWDILLMLIVWKHAI